MRTALLSGLAAMFFLFSAGEPEAAVWTVDPGGGGDFTTIQACLDAAVTGDSCEVSAGTYLENVDFQGKDTTLTSLDGPATTIIDGNGAGPVVTFAGGETGAAVLEGFTVQHGSGSECAGGAGTGGKFTPPCLQVFRVECDEPRSEPFHFSGSVGQRIESLGVVVAPAKAVDLRSQSAGPRPG